MLEKGALKIYWSQSIVGFSLFYKLPSLQSNFPLHWQLYLCVFMNTECIYLVCAQKTEKALGGLFYHSPPWNLNPASPSNAPVSLPPQW